MSKILIISGFIVFIILTLFIFYENVAKKPDSIGQNLSIEKFKLKDGSEIIYIKGYGISYSVGVDRFKNIYIPSFDRGFLYKVSPNLKDYEVFDIKQNQLIKVSENESPPYKKGSFIQPHDIAFDNMGNLYITEMGFGLGKLRGQVTKFSKHNKLIAKIGSDANGGNGLDGPTVSHFTEDGYLYVSEWRADRVLKYNKNYKIEKTFGKINDDKDNLFDYLNKPHAVRMGPNKEIYIADTENHRIVKFDKSEKYIGWIGKRENNTINNDWSKEGNSISGSEIGAFNAIIDLEIFNEEIYVSEWGNHRITKVNLNGKTLGWTGESITKKDKLSWNMRGETIKSDSLIGLNNPFGFRIVDKILYIADKKNDRIKIIKSNLFD